MMYFVAFFEIGSPSYTELNEPILSRLIEF